MARGYRAMLRALEAAALLHHRRPLRRLDAARAALLERWRRGDYARRTLVRLLTAPLKVAHYNDPEMYAHVGCRYGSLPVAQPRSRAGCRSASPPAGRARRARRSSATWWSSAPAPAARWSARELAERGLAVVLLEEGDYHRRDDFTGHAARDAAEAVPRQGATVVARQRRHPHPARARRRRHHDDQLRHLLPHARSHLRDWRTSSASASCSAEALAPYFERVEGVLGVAPADAAHLGGVARVIARGCDALGYQHAPLRRNAPECDGQGVCCFGCPTDAKRSTNCRYVPAGAARRAPAVHRRRASSAILVEAAARAAWSARAPATGKRS